MTRYERSLLPSSNRRRADAAEPVRPMPVNVVCDSCGVTLLGIRSMEPKPIGNDACPKCGGTEFSYGD
ncbi:hypothetical protein [Halopelagius fulvigenes]|uniref:Small CPxCG-related zinc finger protein n=1 Tax=Halopelagius fulvigenes TaxID=1198324 RepID=A0ABD5U3F5_9EURY